MSCNGCRVLRKGCSESCILRSCLNWINTPQDQGNATLFLAKFFGRSDLLSLIAAVPESRRPVLFQSLLFEACGRTVNPVTGAVGLLWSGNWHVCQDAVDTVLSGGKLRPFPAEFVGELTPDHDESSESFPAVECGFRNVSQESFMDLNLGAASNTVSFYSDESSETTTSESNIRGEGKRLLNLFV